MKKASNRGIVIVGGGYRYFGNAWVAVRLLRRHGVRLPIEVWMTPEEGSRRLEELLAPFGVRVRICPKGRAAGKLPPNMRWQWLLKAWSLLHSDFREVLFLDADNFAVRNPEDLFEHPAYKASGAVFWPDIGATGPENPIWKEMGVPFRDEPEFESGQMLIDTVLHREPLELALQMNAEAAKYYKMIWGDKDTFRFAFHKYGRPFAMIPHPLQLLSIPGKPHGDLGVMCQHDFDGNRIFQHRNWAKWDLLGHNPRIPGCLFEEESREYLAELRALWNGRSGWMPARRNGHAPEVWRDRIGLVKDLTDGLWLAEDRRPKEICCGPTENWTEKRVSKPWGGEPDLEEEKKQQELEQAVHDRALEGGPEVPAESHGTTVANGQEPKADVPVIAHWHQGVRCKELKFAEDSTISKGASPEAYWWDLDYQGGEWWLRLSNEEGTVAKLRRTESGHWEGTWVKAKGAKLILKKKDRVYGEESSATLAATRKLKRKAAGAAAARSSQVARAAPLHMANHAFGIGDAITGLYTAVGAAEAGYKVVYHTRYPRWLERASHPRLTITGAPPPKGTPDMDTDHAEQLRYGQVKVRWYGGRVRGSLPAWEGARPQVNRDIRIRRVDFPRYVVISPFAAWESRNWPEMHWRRLAHLLTEAGLEMVVIGTKREAERIARTFDKSYAYWVLRKDDSWVEWVTDLILGAEALLGLDSGMIHMAGLLGVPALSIHAHLPPEFLFACAPSIRSVAAQTSCTFCRWQEDRGFNEGCNTACSALATVGPERVMQVLMPALKKPIVSLRNGKPG